MYPCFNSTFISISISRIRSHSFILHSCTCTLADPTGRQGRPPGSKFFHFHAVFGDNNKLAHQWRIQDFPEEGTPTLKEAIIWPFPPQNCMKLKEFGPRGRASLAPPLDPPMHIHFGSWRSPQKNPGSVTVA